MKGLGQIGSGFQPSQDVLRSRLSSVLELFGPEVTFTVKKVYAFSSKPPIYDVELDSVESVDELLKASFRFSRKKDPAKRPAELEHVSIYHSVTTGTRIRLSLLRVSLESLLSMFLLSVGFIRY